MLHRTFHSPVLQLEIKVSADYLFVFSIVFISEEMDRGRETFINNPRFHKIFTFTVWELLRKGLFGLCSQLRPHCFSEHFCTSVQNYCNILDVIYVQPLWESPDKPGSLCTCSSPDKWRHYVSHRPRARRLHTHTRTVLKRIQHTFILRIKKTKKCRKKSD